LFLLKKWWQRKYNR